MIEVNDVWYKYGDGTIALRGVSVEVREGEMMALMGPTGAGKTTLAKHMNGLLKPNKGYVVVDGMDTREHSVAEIARKVGYVFQNPDNFLFAETVEEELYFTLKNLGFPSHEFQSRITNTLRRLNIEKLRNRSPFSLSGGERRRVALAAVLCAEPQYLILDEPTVGQDFIEKNRLFSILKDIEGEGKSVLVITHDIEFVCERMKKVAIISEGRILKVGRTKEVFSDTELIERAGLIPPRITKLFIELSKFIEVPSDLVSVDEAIVEILKLIGR
ncbi:MAG: energy-coupling factor ABC transporter ATP-binding protein [Candidatus Asgardarchaeia archaeon]